MAARVRPTDTEPVTRLKQASLWSPTRLAILAHVRAHPGVSYSDVARALGRHPSQIIADAHLLRQAGVLLVFRQRGRRAASLHVVGNRRF
jgi:predicted transcriptional regulator